MRSVIVGGPGAYIPYPSHSFISYLGPTTQLLMLDCRAERRLNQVCSAQEYEKVFARVNAMHPGVEHLILQLGIPIAYPRMVFLESFLSNKFNPLVSLGRSGSMLKGMVNKFNADAELLDDLVRSGRDLCTCPLADWVRRMTIGRRSIIRRREIGSSSSYRL